MWCITLGSQCDVTSLLTVRQPPSRVTQRPPAAPYTYIYAPRRLFFIVPSFPRARDASVARCPRLPRRGDPPVVTPYWRPSVKSARHRGHAAASPGPSSGPLFLNAFESRPASAPLPQRAETLRKPGPFRASYFLQVALLFFFFFFFFLSQALRRLARFFLVRFGMEASPMRILLSLFLCLYTLHSSLVMSSPLFIHLSIRSLFLCIFLPPPPL